MSNRHIHVIHTCSQVQGSHEILEVRFRVEGSSTLYGQQHSRMPCPSLPSTLLLSHMRDGSSASLGIPCTVSRACPGVLVPALPNCTPSQAEQQPSSPVTTPPRSKGATCA